MKIHSEKYSTWYMKTIWKIQYKLADAKINCLTWWYSSRLTGYNTLDISYRKKRRLFSALWFYKHEFLSLIKVACIQDLLEKSYAEIFYG